MYKSESFVIYPIKAYCYFLIYVLTYIFISDTTIQLVFVIVSCIFVMHSHDFRRFHIVLDNWNEFEDADPDAEI